VYPCVIELVHLDEVCIRIDSEGVVIKTYLLIGSRIEGWSDVISGYQIANGQKLDARVSMVTGQKDPL